MVEQRTEDPCVAGSIPAQATTLKLNYMTNKCDSSVLNLLLTALLLLSNFASANVNKNAIVGLIAKEDGIKFTNILRNFGAKVIPIKDYEIDKAVKEKNINRIFIVAQEKSIKTIENIHLLSICSNLQNIINVEEVKNKTHEPIKIVPSSHLANVVSKFLLPDQNGWFTVYFHHCNSNRINNNPENRKKLDSLGYKIAGFSNNGTIGAIEDKSGNIYLTDTLIINSDSSIQQELIAISIIYDFLYR